MANRPVFLPDFNGHSLVYERCFDFTWASGFSATQKKKNISALHEEARRNGIEPVLEISTKSSEKVGQRLSAFNLKLPVDGKKCYLESVYQGSKVFEHGGPFNEVFDMPPREAKRFIKPHNDKQLIRFELEGDLYPLSPKNAFYDWLYIRALSDHADWISENVEYEAFTDIEFNPAKQINCQARAFAEYLSLLKRGKLQDAADDFDAFAGMLIGFPTLSAAYDEVLKKGSADFCEPYAKNGYELVRVEEKSQMYYDRYFEMHRDSACKVFGSIPRINETTTWPILFIDFGCGPGTSGVAFHEVCRKEDNRTFHYIGIDRAPAMLDKAKESLPYRISSQAELWENFDGLSNIADRFEDMATVVLNFSFLLAPQTLRNDKGDIGDEETFSDLAGIVNEIVASFGKSSIHLVYHNPKVKNFHSRWEDLKKSLQNKQYKTFDGDIEYGNQKPAYFEIISYNASDDVSCTNQGKAAPVSETVQQDLFPGSSADDSSRVCNQPVLSDSDIDDFKNSIPGLAYEQGYIDKTTGEKLLEWIDEQPWLDELKRRVQHYGWKYDYKAKKVASDMRLGALPVPLMELANNLYTDGYVKDIPDQVIINEYEPGQGIASHTDCKPCFGDTIITISLGSGCVMEFTKEVGESSGNRKKPSMSKNKTPVWLLPRSLVAMTGDARWDWCHGIPQRKSDQWGGKRYKRSRRVSLTFRKVRLESEG